MSLDGVEVPRLSNGNWWVQRPPGTYALKVAAIGFYDYEQKITLAKGDGIGLRADLKPRPALSILSIENGAPGAEVLVDGQSAGALDEKGEFVTPQFSPGQRSLELRKPGYESRQMKVELVAGKTVALRNHDAALNPYGSLQFSITPSAAKVPYQQGDAECVRRQCHRRLRQRWRILTRMPGVFRSRRCAQPHIRSKGTCPPQRPFGIFQCFEPHQF